MHFMQNKYEFVMIKIHYNDQDYEGCPTKS